MTKIKSNTLQKPRSSTNSCHVVRKLDRTPSPCCRLGLRREWLSMALWKEQRQRKGAWTTHSTHFRKIQQQLRYLEKTRLNTYKKKTNIYVLSYTHVLMYVSAYIWTICLQLSVKPQWLFLGLVCSRVRVKNPFLLKMSQAEVLTIGQMSCFKLLVSK